MNQFTEVLEPPPIRVALYGKMRESMLQLTETEAEVARTHARRAEQIEQARQISLQLATTDPRKAKSWSADVVAERELALELACALNIPDSTARALISQSAALVNKLPATMAALREGRISYRHAQVIADHASTLPDEAWAAFEEKIIGSAERLTASRFNQKARRVRERMHPESIDNRKKEAVERRDVFVEPAGDGMAYLTAYVSAEVAAGAFNRLDDMARRFNHVNENRSLGQRRADILGDLLIDGNSTLLPFAAQGIQAKVLITVPVLSLLGKSDEPAELDGFGPIPMDVAMELAAHAPSFTRILTHPETGIVLSVGQEKYRPPADLKAWVRMRDGWCRRPGCRCRARLADIDHIIPWEEGGPTSSDNLESLCEADHNLKHETDWTPRSIGGGIIEWTSPCGLVYYTEPEIDYGTGYNLGAA